MSPSPRRSSARTARLRVRASLAAAAIGAVGAVAAPALTHPSLAATSHVSQATAAQPTGTWACMVLNKYPACINNPFPLV